MLASGQLPPGYVCVPIADGFENCAVFDVTAPAPNGPGDDGPDTWSGDYDIFIAWDIETDPPYAGRTVRLFHAHGDPPTFPYEDITIPGSYNTFFPPEPPCVGYECFDELKVPGDPSIGGSDNDFGVFTTGAQTVPEPASIGLVLAGLGGLFYRRLRARRSPVGPTSTS